MMGYEVAAIRERLAAWLDEKGYRSSAEARGVFDASTAPDPHAWARLNYARMLDGWQLAQAPEWRQSIELSQLGGMAWLAAHWDIPVRQLALGHGFAWLEGAVMAGVKLVPFGQQAAQSLLRDLCAELPAVLEQALELPDEALGGGLPLLAIASARHETQYTRLFRSCRKTPCKTTSNPCDGRETPRPSLCR